MRVCLCGSCKHARSRAPALASPRGGGGCDDAPQTRSWCWLPGIDCGALSHRPNWRDATRRGTASRGTVTCSCSTQPTGQALIISKMGLGQEPQALESRGPDQQAPPCLTPFCGALFLLGAACSAAMHESRCMMSTTPPALRPPRRPDWVRSTAGLLRQQGGGHTPGQEPRPGMVRAPAGERGAIRWAGLNEGDHARVWARRRPSACRC
jgi:hypothetical protein